MAQFILKITCADGPGIVAGVAQSMSVVDHADRIDDLIAQGQDIESRVLARAVKAHIEHRVIPNGQRTVVFK